MFDIGFPEFALLAVVALLVLGPQRLPEALRALGLWIGRIRNFGQRLRTEVEKEIGADEIRRQLHNEETLRSLQKTKAEFQETVNEIRAPIAPEPSKRKSGE